MRSLEILELGVDGRYAHAVGVTAGVLEEATGSEGLEIDLDALWRQLERFEAQTAAQTRATEADENPGKR